MSCAKRAQVPLELFDKLLCSVPLPEASCAFQKSDCERYTNLEYREPVGSGGRESAWRWRPSGIQRAGKVGDTGEVKERIGYSEAAAGMANSEAERAWRNEEQQHGHGRTNRVEQKWASKHAPRP